MAKVFKDDLVEVTYLTGKKEGKTGKLHSLHAANLEKKGAVKIGAKIEKKKKQLPRVV